MTRTLAQQCEKKLTKHIMVQKEVFGGTGKLISLLYHWIKLIDEKLFITSLLERPESSFHPDLRQNSPSIVLMIASRSSYAIKAFGAHVSHSENCFGPVKRG